MDSRLKCCRCRFWNRLDEEDFEDPQNAFGGCHRHAPQTRAPTSGHDLDVVPEEFERLQYNFRSSLVGIPVWPLTFGRDGCGDFQPLMRSKQKAAGFGQPAAD